MYTKDVVYVLNRRGTPVYVSVQSQALVIEDTNQAKGFDIFQPTSGHFRG